MAADVDHGSGVGGERNDIVLDGGGNAVPRCTSEALYSRQPRGLCQLPQLFVARVSPRMSQSGSIIPKRPHRLAMIGAGSSRPPVAEERVFITGGSGFIGTNLVSAYLRKSTPVVSFDLCPPRIAAHRALWTEGDIRDLEPLAAALMEFKPTVVVHLAARTDLGGRTLSDYNSNILGVENLVAATKHLPEAPTVLSASSRLVCQIGYIPRHDTDWRPSTPYGASKVRGERIVRQQCLHAPWVITRPTSIWGPWFGAPYRNFFQAVLSGRYLHPRGRRIHKSFGYVENTVYQLQQLGRAPTDEVAGRVFYLADYEPLEVGDLAKAIAREGGATPVRSVPVGLLRLVAGTGDALQRIGWREPPLTSFRLSNLLTEMVFDLGPLQAAVGELPVGWTEGVRRTVRWLEDESRSVAG